MEALHALLTQAQGLSATPDDLRHLLTLLTSSQELLQRNTALLPNALLMLHPATHSLAYLFLLDAQCSASGAKLPVGGAGGLGGDEAGGGVGGGRGGDSRQGQLGEPFLAAAIGFLQQCDASQIQLAPEKFVAVCRHARDAAFSQQQPKRVVLPLLAAVQKLRPSVHHLTPLHADFFQACLLAKCYSAAVTTLEEDIFEIEPSKTALTNRDFLLFCYYGGLIFVGLKRFEDASRFLLQAVLAPAVNLNAITVAAYKKLVLVSLIHSGQVIAFPKYTSQVVHRNLKTLCKVYVDLTTAFGSREVAEVQKCLSQSEETLKADGNWGLAKQLVGAVFRSSIQRLTQTYLTLSLEDIARSVKLSSAREAEAHVLQMINDGHIFASINQKDGMVCFYEDPERYDTQEMADHVDRQIKRTIQLSKKLAKVEEEIASDWSYIGKVYGKDKHGRFSDMEDYDLGQQRMFDNIH